MTTENKTPVVDIKKVEELTGLDLCNYQAYSIIERLDVLMAMMKKLNEPSAAETSYTKGE